MTLETTVTAPDETPAQPYTIAREDFQRPPETVDHYHPGDRVNRANFVSFINGSFAISMEFPSAHIAYFDWLAIHEGFDGKKAVANFFDAGGIDTLTDKEKEKIVVAYTQVNKHLVASQAAQPQPSPDTQLPLLSDTKILEAFRGQLLKVDTRAKTTGEKNPFHIHDSTLKTITLPDLRAQIQAHAAIYTRYPTRTRG